MPNRRIKGSGRKKDSAPAPAGDEDYTDLLPDPLQRVQVDASLQSMREKIEEAGLEVDEQYEGTMPDWPEDIEAVDHNDLSDLLLSLQAAHSVAVTRASAAHIEQGTMEEITDYLEAKALLASEQSNESKRKAEATTAPEVVHFRTKARSATNAYIMWRDQAVSLNGKIKAISRVGGFKDDDDAASDVSSRIKNSRGTAKRKS